MRTQDAKNIHCSDYLAKIGAKFSRTQNGTHGLEYVYHSPKRDDKNPSLCVNLDRNIWSDVPAGEGGRLIELVCYTNGLANSNVSEALAILDRLFPEYRGSHRTSRIPDTPNRIVDAVLSNTTYGSTSLNRNQEGMTLVEVRDIYLYPLKRYLDERKIPLEIATRYLKEIEYSDKNGKKYYALGWKSGTTYGLRSRSFKGFLAKGIDLSVFDVGTEEICVFEGIFDYLSYLAHKKTIRPPLTSIVMNSVTMSTRLKLWIENTPKVKTIHCYLDNDQPGKQCFESLKGNMPNHQFYDHSTEFSGHKDFSDWFTSL